jgi:hypothetical protein
MDAHGLTRMEKRPDTNFQAFAPDLGDHEGEDEKKKWSSGGPTHGNKRKSSSSYIMNGLRRGRPKQKRAVKMSFRCSPMTRARATYPKRTSVRHSRAGKRFPNRTVLLSCGGERRTLRDEMTRRRSRFKLAIRLGRFFSARAACAPARRIGVSVWRTDFWVKPVRVV